MPVDRETVQREQTQALLDAFGDEVETDPSGWRYVRETQSEGTTDPAPAAIFRRGRIVVQARRFEEAITALADEFGAERVAFRRLRGVRLPGFSQILLPEDVDTLRALDIVAESVGTDAVGLDHLLSITNGTVGSKCPATEPEFVPQNARPWPPVTSGGPDGSGVLVGVIDTGLFADAPTHHEWLAGVTGDTEPETDAQGNIPIYAGHGTFIAGVVRSVAPRADVHVLRTFQMAGGAFETEIAQRIIELVHQGVDVISLSAGTYGYGNYGTAILRDVIERTLPQHKGVVLVVSAGNDDVRTPFLPAAMAGTVAVGALSARGDDKAGFSNHGGWVDVYAPGEDLVNAYAHGTFVYQESPKIGQTQEFAGMARWSGTSFSAPLVAGLIAARMSATGENGVTAAQRLVEFGQTQAIPGVGAVLRPGDALAGG